MEKKKVVDHGRGIADHLLDRDAFHTQDRETIMARGRRVAILGRLCR